MHIPDIAGATAGAGSIASNDNGRELYLAKIPWKVGSEKALLSEMKIMVPD